MGLRRLNTTVGNDTEHINAPGEFTGVVIGNERKTEKE